MPGERRHMDNSTMARYLARSSTYSLWRIHHHGALCVVASLV
eukprot:COSAG01_NODE_52559_length_345_cov_424.077236_1_plen_41_part_01